MQKKAFYLQILMEVLLITTLAGLLLALLLPILQVGAGSSPVLLWQGFLLALLVSPLLAWRAIGFQPPQSGKTAPSATPNINLVSCAILLAGLLLTAAGTRELDKRITKEASARYDKLHERLVAEVERRFALPEYGLRGAANAIAASDGKVLTPERFQAYIQGMSLKTAFPGVIGFGLIDAVPASELARYQQLQQQQAPQFRIRAASEQPLHYIVRHIEPRSDNRDMWGRDLSAHPVGLAALQLAQHREGVTMSGVMDYRRRSQTYPGYMILLHLPPQITAGSGMPAGTRPVFVYSAVSLQMLMSGITDVTEQQLDFELYDSPLPTPGTLVFDADNHLNSRAGADGNAERSFQREQRLSVGSRTLTLRSSSSLHFEASLQRTSVWMVGGMGMIISVLAALSSGLLMRNQRRAQQLAASMTRDLAVLAKVAQHTTNAIVITDQQRHISWVNEGFTRLTGYTLEEVRGCAPGKLLQTADTDQETIRRISEALSARQPFKGNILNRSKSGREYWVAMEIQPLLDEHQQLEGFMAIETDISLQVATEAELHRALLEARTIRDIIQQHFIVSIADPQGCITRVNQAFINISGYQQHELLGRNHRILNAGVHEPSFWRDMWTTLLNGQAWRGEVCNRHKNGSQYWVDSIIVPFHNPQGQIEQYVSIRRDITASKRHEASLQEAKQQAEQANLAKSRFLANMSHEIRTPMNAILGLLQLLQRTRLDAEQQEYAEKTSAAARSLLGLLNDILDFSKIEAGKMTLDLQPFSLDPLLRSLSVILSANRQDKAVEIVFDIPTRLPERLLGDAMRLQQVLTNLASNALKFTEQGEVIISLHPVAQHDQQLSLQFSVRDTGIGISRDLHDKLFHSFSQAESSTTRRFGGTGLGLAISQRIVQQMGSEIQLQSEPGQGSCFSFTLSLPIVAPAPASSLSTMTVWLVESHPATRQAVSGLCQSLGWQTHSLADGHALQAAIAAATSNTPPCQLALIDSQLPDIDSWQACQQLKAHYPELNIILLTAQPQQRHPPPGSEAPSPVAAYLVKPLTADMLQEAAIALQHSQLPPQAPDADASTPALSLAGLRLLLVEDNATNRLVAKGLLGKDGATIDIAENGAEAVAAVAKMQPAYDAVLMDLQMPVMDGISATHEIRYTLGMTRLPIIAMTANAMASDRELCLAAGMTDHIGKPFVLAELRALLLKHIAAARAQP
ncbi:MAG: PAS domain S-box protein [Vogesella sp.]|uniref:CHASE domain-containing hybrid sensor histidine kinase/response regulator n=1 Tax=Vogesella sp. TaxID=1904252 RepID=UPI00391CFDD5